MEMHLLNEEPDEILFNLLKDDNERAFTILYNRYWDKLLEVAFIKLRSQEDSEEVVQQLFFQVWNTRHQTIIKYTFRTYISSALKYTVYSKMAERKKRAEIHLDEGTSDNIADHSTQYLLEFSQVRQEIETLVAQLPDKCQMVYRLSREEGLSAKEISRNMSISEKTVEGHLTKALKYIKRHLTIILSVVLIIFSTTFKYFF